MSRSSAFSAFGRGPDMKGMNLVFKFDTVCSLTVKFLRGHTSLSMGLV